MIRLATRSLAEVGRSSGLIIASSTIGSIAGVFISGFFLIDYFGLSTIFRAMGGVTLMLALFCLLLDLRIARGSASGNLNKQ
jgi:hypothetical protein